MQALTTIVYKINDKMGMLANITLIANMLIIVYSVLGRILFRSPLGGLVDIVSFIFALTCAFSFCYTEKEKGHVRMDLLLQKLPRVGKIIIHSITGAIAIVVLFFIMTSMYSYASRTLAAHNITMTVAIPYFPFVVVLAVSITLFLATMVVNFVRAYEEWRAK